MCDVAELRVAEWITGEKKMFSLRLCVLMCLLTIRNNLRWEHFSDFSVFFLVCGSFEVTERASETTF